MRRMPALLVHVLSMRITHIAQLEGRDPAHGSSGMGSSARRCAMPLALGAIAVAAATTPALASHIRPRGASPFRVPLVPAYNECQVGNGKIAFYSTRGTPGNKEIYSMNSDGTNVTRLTNDAIASADGPSWSPDGTKIAFRWSRPGNDEIYSMNADGSNQVDLTNNAASDTDPDWSPNGRQIVFVSNRDGNNEIYKMNADGTGQTRLTNNTSFDADPTWSPDGTKIAFTSNRTGNNDVFKMNADGSGQTQLTTDTHQDGFPSWKPDGSVIAFQTDRINPNFDVFTMNPDGSGQTRVIVTGRNPGWSPSADGLVYASQASGSFDIWVGNQFGGGNQNLTNDAAEDGMPDWQPSFSSNHGAPLALGSCKPPLQSSSYLTVGTPDANGAAANSVGFVDLKVLSADVAINASVTDVRCDLPPATACGSANAAAGPDYMGSLRAIINTQITDHDNGTPGPGGTDAATVTPFNPSFAIPCTATSSTSVGSTCSVATTANAVAAGTVVAGERANWELGQVEVQDGGNTGDPASGATTFMRQGVFVP